jgi:sterol desaturase/sphingolipid hydroxylase (fatty acid hydroxylase superfamily)
VRREETDSNFGFSVSWWDRLFGTYRAEPADGQLGLTIGLPAYRDAASQTLGRLLLQPFRRLP